MTRGAASLPKRLAVGVGLATLLVTLATLPAPPGTALDQEDSEPGTITEFRWTAPPDMTGTFAAVLHVDPVEETRCNFRIVATGMFEDGNPVPYWLRYGRSLAAGHWERPAQAHARDLVDTREAWEVDGDWWNGPRILKLVRDTLDIAFAGFGLGLNDEFDFETPLNITVSCRAPFTLSLEAGREGRSFTQETLTGGLGATTNFAPEMSLSVNDGLTESFANSHVQFDLAFPSVTQNDHMEGRLTLHHPEGSETWVPPPEGERDASLVGGPGTYELDLDWHARGSVSKQPKGILVGVDPVELLDEVV